MGELNDRELEKIKQDEKIYQDLLKLKDRKGWQMSNVMKVYYKRYLKVLEKSRELYFCSRFDVVEFPLFSR